MGLMLWTETLKDNETKKKKKKINFAQERAKIDVVRPKPKSTNNHYKEGVD